jgi:hypothetical protein
MFSMVTPTFHVGASVEMTAASLAAVPKRRLIPSLERKGFVVVLGRIVCRPLRAPLPSRTARCPDRFRGMGARKICLQSLLESVDLGAFAQHKAA